MTTYLPLITIPLAMLSVFSYMIMLLKDMSKKKRKLLCDFLLGIVTLIVVVLVAFTIL